MMSIPIHVITHTTSLILSLCYNMQRLLYIVLDLVTCRVYTGVSVPGAAHKSSKVLLLSKKWYLRFSWISLNEARERYLRCVKQDAMSSRVICFIMAFCYAQCARLHRSEVHPTKPAGAEHMHN